MTAEELLTRLKESRDLLQETLLELEEDPSFEDNTLYRKIRTFLNNSQDTEETTQHVTSSYT